MRPFLTLGAHLRRHRPSRPSSLRSLSSLTTTTPAASPDAPLRVCVVGSGPSGFYTTKYLLSADDNVHVDMIESLPTPFGLIRSGVAPDHQDVKACQNDFTQVAKSKRFSFFGNVTVGADVTVENLRQRYNAVVFCTGAASDRMLNIPGEHLKGVHSARAVVNWYNSHPDFVTYPLDLSATTTGTCVIIGQGNVAVDCARILSCQPSVLASSDISDYALDALEMSGINRVIMLGRRGHVQASFTMKELRELTKLEGTTFLVTQQELDASMTEATQEEINTGRVPKRMDKLLRKVSDRSIQKEGKILELSFLKSPFEIIPSETDPTAVGGLRVVHNSLLGPAGKQRAVSRNEEEDMFIPCDIVLRSVGYLGVPLDGVAFDNKRAVIANNSESSGRIVNLTSGEAVTGMFTSGWAKRGPSGIVGTNIPCAKETVQSILEDYSSALLPTIQQEGGVRSVLQQQQQQVVDWNGYIHINDHEVQVGEQKGKVRDKLFATETMLQVANSGGAAK